MLLAREGFLYREIGSVWLNDNVRQLESVKIGCIFHKQGRKFHRSRKRRLMLNA